MMTLHEFQREQTDDRDAREAYAGGATVEVATAAPESPLELICSLLEQMERVFYSSEFATSMARMAEYIQETVTAFAQIAETLFRSLSLFQPFTMTLACAPTGEPLYTYSSLAFGWHLKNIHNAEQGRRIRKIQASAARRRARYV